VTFPGQDWRRSPETAASMFQVFSVMRQLKELLWYLSEARAALPAGALRAEVDQVHARTLALVGTPAADLARLDVAAHRAHVGPVLAEVSASLRAGVPGRGSRPGRCRPDRRQAQGRGPARRQPARRLPPRRGPAGRPT
jgi:hypothetical protein